MSEKDLCHDLIEIDKLLGEVRSPALTRTEHDNIRNVMRSALQQIQLSFQLEREKEEVKEEKMD